MIKIQGKTTQTQFSIGIWSVSRPRILVPRVPVRSSKNKKRGHFKNFEYKLELPVA